MVYVIQVCWQLASGIRLPVSKPVWHIPLLCVQWKTPDDGQRNCPKHVEFYSKNKFEKLVHLVGFIIRIYHDAWSPERQIWKQLDRSNYTVRTLRTLHTLLRSKWPSFIVQYTYVGSTHIGDNSFKQVSCNVKLHCMKPALRFPIWKRQNV